MTAKDKKSLLLLFSPDVQAAIKLRAAGCVSVLKPLMSLATGFHTSHELAGKLTAFIKMLTFYRHRSQTGVFDMLRNLPPCSSRYLCVVAYLNRQFQFICCSETGKESTDVLEKRIQELHLFKLGVSEEI